MFSMLALKALPWRLIGIGAGVIALVVLVWVINGWRVDAAERKAKLAVICDATRAAADNPKLKCGQVVAQITELGKSVADLKAAIASQNAAVNDLAAKSAQAQKDAAEASRNAQARARGAEATAERLRASARAGGLSSASCEPSEAVKEAWR